MSIYEKLSQIFRQEESLQRRLFDSRPSPMTSREKRYSRLSFRDENCGSSAPSWTPSNTSCCSKLSTACSSALVSRAPQRNLFSPRRNLVEKRGFPLAPCRKQHRFFRADSGRACVSLCWQNVGWLLVACWFIKKLTCFRRSVRCFWLPG